MWSSSVSSDRIGVSVDVAAANALDGDHWTGWRDLTKTQYPGQWFQVDMQQAQTFDKIVLDNTWALWDSPQQYAVAVSNDGTTWSAPVRLMNSTAMDCGYPSSVQRADGKIVTAYYAQAVENHDRYHLGVALWDAPPTDQ